MMRTMTLCTTAPPERKQWPPLHELL